MKKILCFILLIISMAMVTSCKKEIKLDNNVSVIAPNGTPYIAIGGLLANENIDIEAVNGADNLRAALVSGSHDIVIAPVNLGANLYGKGNSKYKVAAVLTMNNAYIVTETSNKLDGISDIRDEKVIAFGKTGIPGAVLTKIYNENGFDKSNIDFSLASSSAVYSVFAGGNSEAKYALMSQPEIAKLKINNKMDIKVLDLCEVLNIEVPQACIYVNPETKHLDDVNKVLNLIENNIKDLNKNAKSYVKKIIELDRNFTAIGEEVLIESLPKMGIVYKKALDNKSKIEAILTTLGVALPNVEFYYQ